MKVSVNFISKGQLVSFSKDPIEYTIKNIHPSFKMVFVEINGRVFCKSVKKIEKINRKLVIVC